MRFREINALLQELGIRQITGTTTLREGFPVSSAPTLVVADPEYDGKGITEAGLAVSSNIISAHLRSLSDSVHDPEIDDRCFQVDGRTRQTKEYFKFGAIVPVRSPQTGIFLAKVMRLAKQECDGVLILIGFTLHNEITELVMSNLLAVTRCIHEFMNSLCGMQ